MAHLHPVIDDDSHYLINPSNKTIMKAVVDSEETSLTQLDHNSQRVTFEIPRIIDGHDMQLCNVVRVHFINTEFENQNAFNRSVYDVDDLSIKQDTVDTLVFSWLISRDATMYVGTVSFSVEFSCVSLETSGGEDALKVEYSWRTTPYVPGFNVKAGIDNSDTIVGDNYDTVNAWVDSAIQRLDASAASFTQEAKASIDEHAASIVEDAKEDLAAHSIEVSDILVQTTGQDTRKIMSQKAVTDGFNSYNATHAAVLSDIRADINTLVSNRDYIVECEGFGIHREVILYERGDRGLIDGSYYRIKSDVNPDGPEGNSEYSFHIHANMVIRVTYGEYHESNPGGTETFSFTTVQTVPLPEFDEYDKTITLKILDVDFYLDLSATALETMVHVPTVAMICDINGVRTTVYLQAPEEYQFATTNAVAFYDGGLPNSIVVRDALAVYRVPDDGVKFEIDSHGITDISKTATNGLVDTYTINLDNGTKKTFKVTNGEGIQSIELHEEGDYEDTYRILLTSGAEIFFEVPNSNSVGIKGAKSGGVVYVDDVSPAKHTVKTKVRSKNIIPYPYFGIGSLGTVTSDGLTYIVDSSDKGILVNGTTTKATAFSIFSYTNNIPIKVGEKVTLSCPHQLETSQGYLYLQVRIGGQAVQTTTYYGGDPLTFTSEYNGQLLLGMSFYAGVTLDNVKLLIQLERGDTATEYTPYIDPSTVQLTKSGKNMIYPYYQGFGNGSECSSAGITYTKNSDGTITATGLASADSICWLNSELQNHTTSRPIKLPAGNYVLSGCPSGGAMNKYRLCIKMPGEKYFYDVGEGIAFTLESESLIGIYIIIKSGTSLTNAVFKPQLEVGTVKTDYASPDGATYALDSTGAPMTRIPAQAPNMALYTDTLGTIIDMEYNQDINVMFAKINAILERIMEGGS